jgi:Phosphodiester glycosidase
MNTATLSRTLLVFLVSTAQPTGWRPLNADYVAAPSIALLKAYTLPCRPMLCTLQVFKYGSSEGEWCWVRIPRSTVAMRTSQVDKFGNASEIFASTADSLDVLVASGGYFGFDNKGKFLPLGLVISDGLEIRPLKPWATGGVIYQAETLNVVPVGRFSTATTITAALESMPLLFDNGLVVKNHSTGFANRAAIGLDSDGAIVVAGAFASDNRAATVAEFSDFFIAAAAESGSKPMSVLSLDGGPSAHLFFPALNLHFGFTGQRYVPNVMHFWRPR